MSPLRKIFTSLIVVGTLTVGVAACGSSDSNSSSPASVDAWCERLKASEEADEGTEMDETAEIFLDLAKDAPAAISDDMNLLASALSDMETIDFMDEEAVKEFEGKYDEEKIDAATDRIEVFAKEECGLDLNAE